MVIFVLLKALKTIITLGGVIIYYNYPSWIRTSKSWDQNPLPYHLAIGQEVYKRKKVEGGL